MKRRTVLAMAVLVVAAIGAGLGLGIHRARAQALEPESMPQLKAANLRADLAELGRVRMVAQPIAERVAAVCQEYAVRLPDCGNCDGRTVPCDQVDFATGKIARPPAPHPAKGK